MEANSNEGSETLRDVAMRFLPLGLNNLAKKMLEATLVHEIREKVREERWSLKDAAIEFEVPIGAIQVLFGNKLKAFPLNFLESMLASAGAFVHVRADVNWRPPSKIDTAASAADAGSRPDGLSAQALPVQTPFPYLRDCKSASQQLKIRLCTHISQKIAEENWDDHEAAAVLAVGLSDIAALQDGQTEEFLLEELGQMLDSAGAVPIVHATVDWDPPDIKDPPNR